MFLNLHLLWCFSSRMAALTCVRLCPRHAAAGLQLCGYATLGRVPGPQEKNTGGPVFQYVGEHKKPTHKVFVWGFSFSGALGIPSFVVPDSGRKKPRKYQLTPYRLDTAEQVNLTASVYVNQLPCFLWGSSGLDSRTPPALTVLVFFGVYSLKKGISFHCYTGDYQIYLQ